MDTLFGLWQIAVASYVLYSWASLVKDRKKLIVPFFVLLSAVSTWAADGLQRPLDPDMLQSPSLVYDWYANDKLEALNLKVESLITEVQAVKVQTQGSKERTFEAGQILMLAAGIITGLGGLWFFRAMFR